MYRCCRRDRHVPGASVVTSGSGHAQHGTQSALITCAFTPADTTMTTTPKIEILPVALHWNDGPHVLAALYMNACMRSSRRYSLAKCPALSLASYTVARSNQMHYSLWSGATELGQQAHVIHLRTCVLYAHVLACAYLREHGDHLFVVACVRFADGGWKEQHSARRRQFDLCESERERERKTRTRHKLASVLNIETPK